MFWVYESEYMITQYLVKVIVGSDMTNVNRGDEQLYLEITYESKTNHSI